MHTFFNVLIFFFEGSEGSLRSSVHSRPETPLVVEVEPVVESKKSSRMLRKRGPKSKTLNDISTTSIPVSKMNNTKNNDDSKLELKEEKSDEEQGVEESRETEAEKELNKTDEAELKVYLKFLERTVF